MAAETFDGFDFVIETTRRIYEEERIERSRVMAKWREKNPGLYNLVIDEDINEILEKL